MTTNTYSLSLLLSSRVVVVVVVILVSFFLCRIDSKLDGERREERILCNNFISDFYHIFYHNRDRER